MQGIETYLFTQGVLGVMLFIVGGAFLMYYRSSQKKIDDLTKLVYDQLNLRVEEQKTIGKDATNALKDNSQALYVISEKIETNKAAAARIP